MLSESFHRTDLERRLVAILSNLFQPQTFLKLSWQGVVLLEVSESSNDELILNPGFQKKHLLNPKACAKWTFAVDILDFVSKHTEMRPHEWSVSRFITLMMDMPFPNSQAWGELCGCIQKWSISFDNVFSILNLCKANLRLIELYVEDDPLRHFLREGLQSGDFSSFMKTLRARIARIYAGGTLRQHESETFILIANESKGGLGELSDDMRQKIIAGNGLPPNSSDDESDTEIPVMPCKVNVPAFRCAFFSASDNAQYLDASGEGGPVVPLMPRLT